MSKQFLFLQLLLLFVFKIHFGQNVLINEFCASNTLYSDEDNDTPDWIELYNNTTQTVNLLNYSLSDEQLVPKKWVLPNIDLLPKQTLLIYASGKDRTILSNYSTLINQGDIFSYKIGSADISADWKNIDFDDSSWEKGESGFGYGDNDDETLINEGTLSVFVRKVFVISKIEELSELLFHIDYDDGFVAYINGQEIARANLGTPNTEVPYNQPADSYIEPFIINGKTPELYTINIDENIVKNGTNVLCIQVHNNSETSSDLTLIPFLTLNYKSAVNGYVPDVLNLSSKNLHSNFKISADGEQLLLFDNNSTLIDQVDSIPLLPDISYGRLENNINQWVYFATPTPNQPNSINGYTSINNDTVYFSVEGGQYTNPQQINLSNNSGSNIYYTTDGTLPNKNSILYTAPIEINKTTVLKAISISDDNLSITPTTHTYIFESRSFILPIVSISMNPADLWDWNTGIYVEGPNAESNLPYYGANYWMDWEKQMYFEYFDKNGKKLLGAPGGIKIFGGWSRAAQQKSFALFARKAYGVKSFDYPFFDEKPMTSYKSLVLRNGGNDNEITKIRDPFMTSMLEDIDIDRQAYQPVAVYLNGEYWGILGLREKVNENFIENNHLNVDADEIDLLAEENTVLEGSNEHYIQMINYIKNNNIQSKTVYDSVSKLMDIENFIEYQVAQIYYDNQDWPGNNIKFWRPQKENGRWRWIIYDTDFAYGIYNDVGYKENTLAFAMEEYGPAWPNPPWSTFLLRQLMENDTFKARFVNRFADRLNTNFSSENALLKLEYIADKIKPELSYHNQKWENMYDFNSLYNVLEEFALERPFFMRQHINSTLGQGGIVNLTVDVSDEIAGSVQLNVLGLSNFPWTGKYFKNTPVNIQAIANPGFEFSHWEGYNSNAEAIEVSLSSGSLSLKAVFKSTSKTYAGIVINEINYNSDNLIDCGDWIELYNTTEVDIDLSNWKLKDGYTNQAFSIPTGTVIGKRDYLVVCRNYEKFSAVYPSVKNVIGELPYGLASIADQILLYHSSGSLIDSVLYLNESPWPKINSNQTISLIKPQTDNSKGYNWDESIENGTPGTHNDYYTNTPETETVSTGIIASAYPNPMQEFTILNWNCPIEQKVSIMVFDINGKQVNELYNALSYVGDNEINWTPKNIESGIYFIRFSFENGNQETIKLIKY